MVRGRPQGSRNGQRPQGNGNGQGRPQGNGNRQERPQNGNSQGRPPGEMARDVRRTETDRNARRGNGNGQGRPQNGKLDRIVRREKTVITDSAEIQTDKETVRIRDRDARVMEEEMADSRTAETEEIIRDNRDNRDGREMRDGGRRDDRRKSSPSIPAPAIAEQKPSRNKPKDAHKEERI